MDDVRRKRIHRGAWKSGPGTVNYVRTGFLFSQKWRGD